ncbi:glycosyltransferase family 2 protein [Streptomyces sp. NPDC056480]|uniref:glycosyltransferase family 2 protein n=1 Tax=Streptomyces sp. NPDC056480 TaxID=3345833 RepID=UPI00368C3B4C
MERPHIPDGSDPAVSVIIPCYNYARYLPAAVASVLAQTFTDWELIIVDDGSTDGSAAAAESLIKQHPARRIRLLRQRNSGVSAARNTGIRAARGRYILPLDADDMIAPAMLERTEAVLDASPGIAVVSTDLLVFTDDRLPPQRMSLPPFDRERMTQQLIMFYCSLYRREVWQTVGGYDESMTAGEDWDFWVACVEHGFDARHIPEALFGARNKDSGLHVESAENDLAIRARIVVNHPGLFKPVTLAWANALLDGGTGQDTDPRVPDELLTRAAEQSASLRTALTLQATVRRQHRRIKELEERVLNSQGSDAPRTSPPEPAEDRNLWAAAAVSPHGQG